MIRICKDPDGGVGSWGYSQWGPGKTDLVTCDIAAMISPEMFRDFVKPALAEQCAGLDYPILHLDGTQCLCHLDHILDIEPLRAVEWTPNTDEPGTHERWFPIYKRILDAGKSVQILGGSTWPDMEIRPTAGALHDRRAESRPELRFRPWNGPQSELRPTVQQRKVKQLRVRPCELLKFPFARLPRSRYYTGMFWDASDQSVSRQNRSHDDAAACARRAVAALSRRSLVCPPPPRM